MNFPPVPLTPAPFLFRLCWCPVPQGSTIDWYFFLQHIMPHNKLDGTTQPQELQYEYRGPRLRCGTMF